MRYLFALLMLALGSSMFGQHPPPEALSPGVPQELARWRAAHYSDVRYKLNLTLEKMSPVLKGTMEVRVRVSGGDGEKGSGGRPGTQAPSPASPQRGDIPPIILDWRKIRGHEEKSTISNVSINGRNADTLVRISVASTRTGTGDAQSLNGLDSLAGGTGDADKSVRVPFEENNEHLIFRDGVVAGENVIKLDFTSPILTSGSAITRYIDKEDGSEYIYSLFVPSDASTAFPVFDQPDLKARFGLFLSVPDGWTAITNTPGEFVDQTVFPPRGGQRWKGFNFEDTKPISTYVFAFAAGPWEKVSMPGAEATKSVPPAVAGGLTRPSSNAAATTEPSISPTSTIGNDQPPATAGGTDKRAVSDGQPRPVATAGSTDKMAGPETFIYVRKSQAVKFRPHAAEVFRLNREAIKYFEEYFNYKLPWPKYDLVLIPEFPFGGMEHAGATFLRESAIIFPQEPTRNDHISRALLMFHEASHQWFGDTVTMRWFDDLWLKEGFATFTAYKAMEKIVPEMLAWKVFYERVKQAAYQTDSTKGTTAIYQPIANLSAAKSAYGNIVYNKAPAFLRQAEFYLGEDKFQTAVRAFLKKHEYANAGWEDLVTEFEGASNQDLKGWSLAWVKQRGIGKFTAGTRTSPISVGGQSTGYFLFQSNGLNPNEYWQERIRILLRTERTDTVIPDLLVYTGAENVDQLGRRIYPVSYLSVNPNRPEAQPEFSKIEGPSYLQLYQGSTHPSLVFPNYGDYGYGIFLLDDKSRDYVLKNIQNEKDPFLRSMMWGALWDSVREGELDPREYVELVVKVLQRPARKQGLNTQRPDKALTDVRASATEDESTTALLLNRVGTAMNYYIGDATGGNASVNERASGVRRLDARSLTVASLPVDLRARVENLLIDRMQNAPTLGQRITFYRAFLNIAASEKARGVLKGLLRESVPPAVAGGDRAPAAKAPPTTVGGTDKSVPLKTKDKFDIVTRLLILGDPDAPKLLAELEKAETGDDAKRYAYAARAGIGTAENKAKYWSDFVSNKEISESWIEAAFGPWNSIRHSEVTLPYLQRALQELPNHKRSRKIFFVNGWLGAFIGGQRSEEALGVVNKFLADNPNLDNDLRLKILENVDLIERAVRIRQKHDR